MSRFIYLLCSIIFIYSGIIANEANIEKNTCPVCNKKFAINIVKINNLEKYYGESIRESDLSDSPSIFQEIISCPYCMYSSTMDDFFEISDEDRQKLLIKLQKIQIKLNAVEKSIKFEDYNKKCLYLKGLLAKYCNEVRQKNKKRELRYLLHMYFLSKNDLLKVINSRFRKKCIKLISNLLNNKQFSAEDEYVLTYLLGEFYRLDGKNKKALICFQNASKLSEKFFVLKNWSDEKNWVKIWAYKQTCRIKYIKLSKKELSNILNANAVSFYKEEIPNELVFKKRLVLEILGKNNDTVSWEIIRNYVLKDKNRLFELNYISKLSKEKLMIDIKLWDWLKELYIEAAIQLKNSNNDEVNIWEDIVVDFKKFFVDSEKTSNSLDVNLLNYFRINNSIIVEYQVQKNEKLIDISNKKSIPIQRILELNPELKVTEQLKDETNIKLIYNPDNYFEDTIIKAIIEQIKSKNINAINYIFEWFSTINDYSLVTYSDLILEVFDCLKSQNKLWELPKTSNFKNNSQKLIYDCLSYLKNQEHLEKKLVTYIDENSTENLEVVVGCFKLFNSKVAKNAVFNLLTSGRIYFGNNVSQYLIQILKSNDILDLARLIPLEENNVKNTQLYILQKYIENIIFGLHLKDAFRLDQ